MGSQTLSFELWKKISQWKGTDDGTRQTEDWGGGPPGWSASGPTPAETGELEGKLTVSVGGEAFEGESCTKWCIGKVVLMF